MVDYLNKKERYKRLIIDLLYQVQYFQRSVVTFLESKISKLTATVSADVSIIPRNYII